VGLINEADAVGWVFTTTTCSPRASCTPLVTEAEAGPALAVVELATGLTAAGGEMCGAAPSFERFIGGSVDRRRVLGEASRFGGLGSVVEEEVENERGFVV
jgi:hypothetical protein